MIEDALSIEEIAAAWLEAERRVEAEAESERLVAGAREMADRYDAAIRDATMEDLRLSWEAARKIQGDRLVGSPEWAEARRVAVLLHSEYRARGGK